MAITVLPINLGVDPNIAPGFQTAVNPSEGGNSGRSSFRDETIRVYSYNIGPNAAEEVYKIHLACRGRRHPLALRDWGFNYVATNALQSVTAVDSGSVSYLRNQLVPATGSRFYNQRVLVPDERFVALTMLLNGSPYTSFTIADPGVIVHSGTPSGTLTASFQYLIPVCFIDDALPMVVHIRNPDTDELQVSLPAVHFEEILEPEFRTLMGLDPLP